MERNLERNLVSIELEKKVNFIYSRNKKLYSFKNIENISKENEQSFINLFRNLEGKMSNRNYYTMIPEHSSKIIDIDKMSTDESKILSVEYNELKVLYPKISADGIYTEDLKKKIVLCPADCMAVGIFDINRGAKALIHSGWKGTLKEISVKCVNLFKLKGSNLRDLKVIIGPSISKENFIIKEDIIDLFNEFVENKLGEAKELYICKNNKNTYNVDLRQILIKTLYNRGIKKEQILSIEEDTYSSKKEGEYSFHSFRRDKDKSRRNIVII